jgi:uncharacterized membrane protein YhdT
MGRRRRTFFGRYSGKKLLITWCTLLAVVGASYLHKASGFEGVEDYNEIAEILMPVIIITGVFITVIVLFSSFRSNRSGKSKD